jgi:glycosyltransferase involved in cell wall biosynthesis
VLAVGNLQPRKNIPRLIEAWEIMRSQHRAEVQLVIVGRKAWLFDETIAARDSSRSRDKIIFTGYVDDFELPALYSGASLFVYPSLFEGFGLPPLESMACGTPAVVSTTSSLPEICGDAAEYADPYSAKSIADAMLRLLVNDELRNRRITEGLRQVEKFRKGQLGAATVKAYEEAALAL